MNPQELHEVRLAIRPEKEHIVEDQLQSAYGKKFSRIALLKSMQEVSMLLNEEEEKQAVRESMRHREYETNVQPRRNNMDIL